MTQAAAKFKDIPHWRIYPESIKSLYEQGIITARGAVYAAIQAARKPGHKFRIKSVKEFGKQLGLSQPSTYRAISELRSRDLIEWTEVGGLDVWIPETGKVLSFSRTDSQNGESSYQNRESILRSENPILNIEKQTGFKSLQGTAPRVSPNYSFNSSSINSQCVLITHTGEAEVLESEPEEQGSDLSPVATVMEPVNSGTTLEQIAEDQSSAAPPSTILDFENSPGAKCNAMFNRGSEAHDWEDYPGHPKADFFKWYGDRFYAKAPNAFQSKTDWTRSMLRNQERAAAAWADYQEEVQQAEQVREQVAIAHAAPDEAPAPNVFGQPTNDDELRERILGNIQAAKVTGMKLSAWTLAKAKELGIELEGVSVSDTPASEPTPPVIPPAPILEPEPQPEPVKSFAQLASMFSSLGLSLNATVEGDVDAGNLLAQIDILQERLGWSQAELDNFAYAKYGKDSTHKLEDDELEGLLELLKEQS